MKYVFRRAVLGLIAVPVVAGVYVFGYLTLVVGGAQATVSLSEAWSNGLMLGVLAGLMFAFATQISNLLDKLDA